MFKNRILRKLNTGATEKQRKNNEYYLNKLIEVIQTLNGVQENNLKPQGNAKQNEFYNQRVKEMKLNINDYVEFIGSDLSVIQNSKTGLYNLVINDMLYEVPKRKVEIIEGERIFELEYVLIKVCHINR